MVDSKSELDRSSRSSRRPPLAVAIRPARLSDVGRLIELYLGQSEESRGLYHPFPFNRPRLRAIFTAMVLMRPFVRFLAHRTRIHVALLLVACLPGTERPIGYGNSAFIHPDGPEPHAFFGYLVDPAYQSRGVGAQLHDALVDAAIAIGVTHGGGIIMTQNAANVALVSKLGLTPTESDIVDRSAPGAVNYRVDIDLLDLQAKRSGHVASVPVPQSGSRIRWMDPSRRRRAALVGGVFAVAVVLVLAGVLAVVPLRSASTGPPPVQFLYLGTSAPFPPFESYNATNMTYSGFDIAYASLFAQALHRTLVVENYANLSDLLTAVGSGQVALAGSAIAVEAGNNSSLPGGVEISLPYRNAGQAVLVLNSSNFTCPEMNCTPDDLVGQTVGVMAGRASDTWVVRNLVPLLADPGEQVHHFFTVAGELDALADGNVDALVIDEDVANSIALESGGLYKVVGETTRGEVYCFAVPPGDPAGILPVVDQVIVQSQSNGTYQELANEYFA
jgi:ABC-type amino acid transport substrate-binding protein/RimJ/RimL family protein N-acetyltransferase